MSDTKKDKGYSHERITKAVYKSKDQAKHKEQGDRASARARGRSLGSEYAYAVESVLEQAKDLKGSSKGFLGKEKVDIDTKDLAKNKHLTKVKSAKSRKKKV